MFIKLEFDFINSGTECLRILKSLDKYGLFAVLDLVPFPVTTITFLRGYGNIIIIDHGGDYYSVYGNLENISVTENEYVDESMKLAIVAEKQGTDSSLHFEVWGDFKKLNPEDWLK